MAATDSSSRVDYLVIGGGIVGLATAHALLRARPAARLVLLEKEHALARHQSGHNSGVIHAGVYYPADSLKARYCRAGAAATYVFCATHGIPHRRCGKLIVATDRAEVTRLDALAARAVANGLDCARLDAAALAERAPALRGQAALWVADTGMADYPALCATLGRLVAAAGGRIELGAAVTSIAERDDGVTVETAQASWFTRRLVVCAGLQSDRLARAAGLAPDLAIVPFRGDYYRLPLARAGLVDTHVYPVPDPGLPFLGVHLTLTIDGGIVLGPSAMLALARERYRRFAWTRRDAREALLFPGLWRLLARHPRAGLREFGLACSRRLYLAAVRRYCPALRLSDLASYSCGIRAQAVARSGALVHDFAFARTARSLHVLNAPSPAATSAFPIADAIVQQVVD